MSAPRCDFTLRVEGVELWCRCGVTEEERAVGQRLVIDVRLVPEQSPGLATDELAGTIDYGAVVGLVREAVEGHEYRLIERLADEICGRLWGAYALVEAAVTVRKPAPPATEEEFADFGYPRAVDHARAEREHAAFRALLEREDADVVFAGPDEAGLLDAIFAYDTSLITDAGAVLLRPGKNLRLPEVALAEGTFAELGIPVIGRIEAPGTVEGGDTAWLDERTLAVGRGYRTNDEGIRQLRALLGPHGIEVMTVDLPHWRGPGECLHLMSMISPVADRLAVVYLPLMSAPFVEELQRRGWAFIEVPDEEFDTHGCNVLALAPKHVLV